MRRAGLQGLAILHHGFDAVGFDRAREPLALGLDALDDRHRHVIFGEGGVDVEDFQRLFDRLVFRGVGRVAFLPEEFGRAEKQPGAKFPADDVGPLVDQNRQVAVRLHPTGIHLADNHLARRPHDQRLLELAGRPQATFAVRFESMMRHHRTFLGEALDVCRLLLQIAQRDEQREVSIAVSGRLEHAVQHPLHVFPDRISPGLNHHAAAHRRSLGQVGGLDDLLIPLRVVFFARGGDCVAGFLGHGEMFCCEGFRWSTMRC